MPKISVVMPAYNASAFIGEAIESVINQTLQDWELIIVDDKSTDSTYAIVKSYAEKDNRIKLFQMERQSGSAFQPRNYAIKKCSTECYVSLDADDYLSPDFLQVLTQRYEETGADLVMARMRIVTIDGKPTNRTVPDIDFDMSQIMTSKDAFISTLNGWKIGFNGLFTTTTTTRALELYKDDFVGMNADELFSRKLALCVKKIAFAPVEYFYRQNPNSITQKVSVKFIDTLETNRIIKKIGAPLFQSEQDYDLMEMHMFSGLYHNTEYFIRHRNCFSIDERRMIKGKLEKSWEEIEWNKITTLNPAKKLLHSYNFHAFYLLQYLKFELKQIVKKIIGRS